MDVHTDNADLADIEALRALLAATQTKLVEAEERLARECAARSADQTLIAIAGRLWPCAYEYNSAATTGLEIENWPEGPRDSPPFHPMSRYLHSLLRIGELWCCPQNRA